MLTALRTVAQIDRLRWSLHSSALVVRGPAERVAAADWLIHELDQPPREISEPEVHESPMTVALQDRELPSVIRVFFATRAGIPIANDMLTSIRTVADVTRLFSFTRQTGVLALSAPLERMNLAEWVFRELDQDSAARSWMAVYPIAMSRGTPWGVESQTTMVYHLARGGTRQELDDLAMAMCRATGSAEAYGGTATSTMAIRGPSATMPKSESIWKQWDQAGGH